MSAKAEYRFYAQNRRAVPLHPELRRLLEKRQPLPLVRYDAEFAAWQGQFPVKDARWHFERLKEALK